MNLKLTEFDLYKRFNCDFVTKDKFNDKCSNVIWEFHTDNDEIMNECIQGSIEFTEMIIRSGYKVTQSSLEPVEYESGWKGHQIIIKVNIPYADFEII